MFTQGVIETPEETIDPPRKLTVWVRRRWKVFTQGVIETTRRASPNRPTKNVSVEGVHAGRDRNAAWSAFFWASSVILSVEGVHAGRDRNSIRCVATQRAGHRVGGRCSRRA